VSEIEFAERSKRGDDRYFLMFVAMTFNPLLLILELVGCARAVFAVPLGPRPLSLSFLSRFAVGHYLFGMRPAQQPLGSGGGAVERRERHGEDGGGYYHSMALAGELRPRTWLTTSLSCFSCFSCLTCFTFTCRCGWLG
jgi:hypothetical protein